MCASVWYRNVGSKMVYRMFYLHTSTMIDFTCKWFHLYTMSREMNFFFITIFKRKLISTKKKNAYLWVCYVRWCHICAEPRCALRTPISVYDNKCWMQEKFMVLKECVMKQLATISLNFTTEWERKREGRAREREMLSFKIYTCQWLEVTNKLSEYKGMIFVLLLL